MEIWLKRWVKANKVIHTKQWVFISKLASMTFEEILKHDNIRLPIENNGELSYRQQLFKMLDEVEKLVLDSNNLIDKHNFHEEHFKKRYRTLNTGIKTAVEYYHKGDPVAAYDWLEDAINKSRLLSYLPPTAEYSVGCNFYRMRVKDDNTQLKKENLFHVPFEKRQYIKTQRYSIPGFPTLYLSNNLFVAWEEMRRPDFNKTHVVRLENKKKITCLDLTTYRYSIHYEWKPKPEVLGTKEMEDLYSVMVWPLIAACSFKVPDVNVDFKPEYIIPQLMLQYVSRNKNLSGIKFSSTHIDLNNDNFKFKGDFYNLAVPVKFDDEEGYCRVLMDDFYSTEVLSPQIKRLSQGSTTYLRNKREAQILSENVQTIELIKGKRSLYVRTDFGDVEMSLLDMPVSRVVPKQN